MARGQWRPAVWRERPALVSLLKSSCERRLLQRSFFFLS